MFEDKATEWRIEEAKRATKRVVDHAVDLLWINESNAVTLYSDVLAKQIPPSYAAHAFNVFRKAMFQIEIVRLCALWDKAKLSLERETIPTVIELIDDPAVLTRLSETARAQYSVPVRDEDAARADSDVEVLNFYHAKAGQKWAERALAELQGAIASARNLQKSELLEAIRNLRDLHVAHNLSNAAKNKAARVETIKYGDEKRVLEETLSIITHLYCWINGVGFSFQASRKIDRKCVEGLWNNCTFRIERERSKRGAPP
jgi:hypothetical protein